MRILHRKMEGPFGSEARFPLTVEVGAGDGQHLPFVRHSFDRYILTDIRCPSVLPQGNGVSFLQADAHSLPFEEGEVDRLVVTCVLHHLMSPEEALQNWASKVRSGGILTILLPGDPGVVHRLGRHLTTRPAANRLGIDFDLEMAREHRNHALSLMKLVDHVFLGDKVKYVGLPFPWRTWNFNFGQIFQIHKL
jgi:phosphatidylethanolamine/phosphatidyl-N-methylethanolamine N-methyltransferase